MLLQISEPAVPKPAVTIGIDFGTTNSVVAYVKAGDVKFIPQANGATTLPSVYALTTTEECLIGYTAEEYLSHTPQAVVRSVKRLLAKDTSAENPEQKNILNVNGHKREPIEIAAEIFKALKAQAEAHLQATVRQAVVSVPAYFDDNARNAVRWAAKLAGLEVLRLVAEPTAAAISYGIDAQKEGTYVVYDLGGGTFDVTVLKIENGLFQVLATGGDSNLGGDDIDEAILNHFVDVNTLSPTAHKQALMNARRAKEVLSQKPEASFVADEKHHTLTVEKLHDIAKPFVSRTLRIMHSTIKEAKVKIEGLDGVILVGGATRMPYISDQVAQALNQKPLQNINPDEVVAAGAARQAHNLTKDNQFLLLDVTPLSLGIETMGNLVEKIIHRNTPIPVTKTQTFTTFKDNQQGLVIHVVQGERELASECRSLGKFELSGIPPMEAGMARIDITFNLDANGLLEVSAREQTTNTQQKITVQPSHNLDETTLKKMVLEAQAHGKEDMSERLLKQATIEAERLLLAVEKGLAHDAPLLSATECADIEAAKTALEKALASQDRETILGAKKQLEPLAQTLGDRRLENALRLSAKD